MAAPETVGYAPPVRAAVLTPLLLALLAAVCRGQEEVAPFPALQERYREVDVAVYTLERTEPLPGGPLVSRTRVVFVRGQGHRVEAPVEWAVYAGGVEWRCANHGLPGHFHMVEERPWDRAVQGDEAGDDLLLALLAGHRDVLRPWQDEVDGWTRQGNVLRGTTRSGNALELELDGSGALVGFTTHIVGRVVRRVVDFQTPAEAPPGALSLGEPSPGRSWHDLMATYLQPRLGYVLRVTDSQGLLQPPRQVTGLYEGGRGLRVHVGGSPDDVFGRELLVSDLAEKIWTSGACAGEPDPRPHACRLRERAFSDEALGEAQLNDDFLLAALLQARGIEHWRWTRPWTRDGERWLLHGEAPGWITEARFDPAGRLTSLQRLDLERGGAEVSRYEIVELARPGRLPARAFQVDPRVHRRQE